MQRLPAATRSALFVSLVCTSAFAASSEEERQSLAELESEPLQTVDVIADRLFVDTTNVSPVSTLTTEDIERLNVTTTEDTISHEPSLIVRKRYIGDPNGVIGIRGSNMFQGTRSMVFVDGQPLHYHLQTRFSGSPRWSLVSPDEIEEVNVIYGPYSSEYSGNAMGGVVDIKTKTPTDRKVILKGQLFSQDYDELATDETYNGGKLFLSFEDRIGDLSIYTSYNHLENDSQPLTFFESNPSAGNGGTAVSGSSTGVDEFGNEAVYYGDSGEEEATTDLVKLKLGYDLDNFQVRANIAYEQREREQRSTNNFLRDANGDRLYDGTAQTGDGREFRVRGSNFQNRKQERDSLLYGLGFSGLVAKTGWAFDAFYSRFEIVDDEEVRTGRNPNDPDFDSENANFRGRITEFDDTGWQIFDIKFGTETLFGDPAQRLSVGWHYDDYELNIVADDYNSITGQRDSDETDGNRATGRSDSGGKARTSALFAQYGYNFNDVVDLAVGVRFEDWETRDGFSAGRELDRRSEDLWSPKFSLAWFANDDLTLRYSISRAVRFPIVEELFRNDGATSNGSVFLANPNLEPEIGIFQNVAINYSLKGGYIGLNFYRDVVDNVIFNQTTRTDIGSITTSLPTDEVTTKGIELVYNQQRVLGSRFGMRFNVSFTESEITRNRLNDDIVGNQFPRTPRWRSNLLVNYDISETFDVATSLRYASNSFGRLDNEDTASNVFGAQDRFVFVGLKANWNVTPAFKVSAGVDNLFNEEAYVFHPWPSRTVYLEGRYELNL